MSKKPPRPAPESVGLPPGGVETHAHLDFEAFDPDREAVLARARGSGISRIINVFLSAGAWERGESLFSGHPEVSFIAGLHPNDPLSAPLSEELERLEAAFAQDPRLRAVGEIGLDSHWDDVAPKRQAEVFRAQLRLARRLERPVVIHCREAEQATIALLLEEGFAGYPLLWHCFGGDEALAGTLLRHGWLLSIPGPLTYPGSEPLRRAVASLPADRFVLETDCPFLTPQPWRGRRNEPALVAFTAQAAADARNEPVADLWLRCGETARKFFGLT